MACASAVIRRRRFTAACPPTPCSETEEQFAAGRYRLLFVAPERLLHAATFAAHGASQHTCLRHRRGALHQPLGTRFSPGISPPRRAQERFPRASVHAYTATATERVRADIAEQFRLQNPTILVGNVRSSQSRLSDHSAHRRQAQVLEVLRRHPGQAAIVYCISRNDTEAMAHCFNAMAARRFLSRRHGSRRTAPHTG